MFGDTGVTEWLSVEQPRVNNPRADLLARCGDGKLLALHLSSPQKFWESFVDVIDRPDLKDDARFATRDARVRNYAILEKELTEILAGKDRLYWVTKLERADVPFAPVQTVAEVLEDVRSS